MYCTSFVWNFFETFRNDTTQHLILFICSTFLSSGFWSIEHTTGLAKLSKWLWYTFWRGFLGRRGNIWWSRSVVFLRLRPSSSFKKNEYASLLVCIIHFGAMNENYCNCFRFILDNEKSNRTDCCSLWIVWEIKIFQLGKLLAKLK